MAEGNEIPDQTPQLRQVEEIVRTAADNLRAAARLLKEITAHDPGKPENRQDPVKGLNGMARGLEGQARTLERFRVKVEDQRREP